MRGLPFNAEKDQIVEFFGAHATLVKSDVVIELHRDGRKTGKALVFFEEESTALLARAALDRQSIGNRYIELFDHTIKGFPTPVVVGRQSDSE